MVAVQKCLMIKLLVQDEKMKEKTGKKPGRPTEMCNRILCKQKILLVLTKERKIF